MVCIILFKILFGWLEFYFLCGHGQLVRLGCGSGRDQRGQIWIIETETKTENVWVSMTRLSPRLKRSEFQWRDRYWDWKGLSLNDKTETETEKSESRWRDQDWKNMSLNNKTGKKMSIRRLHRDTHWYLLVQGAHNGPICRIRSFKWPNTILPLNIGQPFVLKVRYFPESQIFHFFKRV